MEYHPQANEAPMQHPHAGRIVQSRGLRVKVLRPLIITVCVLAAIASTQLVTLRSAMAAKPSLVTKLTGEVYSIKSSFDGKWLATWVNDGKGEYVLYAVETTKGDRFEVDKSKDPGGICWIPGKNRLLYVKGFPVKGEQLSFTRVSYFTYDTATQDSTKVTEVSDFLQTYIIDPVAADDGRKAFHMTVNGGVPSFNIYLSEPKLLSPMSAKANIGSEYDLSSDGSTVFWPLNNADNGNFYIAGWSLENNKYNQLYEYPAISDPAGSRAMFKVDSANRQAATLASNDKDPSLKACVYLFKDPKNPKVLPVKLNASEEIGMFDWKGRAGALWFLAQDSASQDKIILEFDPFTKTRTEVLRTRDPITSADYSPGGQCYYYSFMDKGTSLLMKLK
jgi:hypothetical protein